MRTDKTNVVDIIMEDPSWSQELLTLREIILPMGLKEEIKWGGPLYTLDGRHVLAIGGFKNYFAIWFHHGVFLSDPNQVLVNAGEGRTRGLRQWRFASAEKIRPALIRKYIKEAIKNSREGKEIRPEKKAAIAVPAELQSAFRSDKALKTAFQGLTPGKQREYLEYIAEAKTEATREKRVGKIMPMILEGQGLNDKYKGKG
jgi:uncharacterized protein YdeI (YjbR/CyaY-like superfamily)